ncbi:Eco57I restriction-modification methylase domain-containing protein [Planctellipticum variicoloris]|uniref:Eco57I restriction-modification methylase domain-containing protein n=1 Tax=Planctellipticum variicoloris TaxID=3064265 RepID=UPI003013577C|nr:hypothetical protein SH412_003252 [Planctomycetaceae bacterium SH412]
MSQSDTAHAWWSRLRHQGLLLSPVVMIERFPEVPPAAPFHARNRLRDAHTRLTSRPVASRGEAERDPAAVLGFVDSLLEHFIGHPAGRLARQHSIPENLTVAVRIGSRSETIKPHRVLFADDGCNSPALLVMADTSAQVGRGRGRTAYARFLELLRGTGHRLGLLTNGEQFRLIYAGLDFESWCEWESERWFDDGEGTEELHGLRQLLSPASLQPVKDGVSSLLDAVEESRKRQADLSSVLRENVRQAIELLLEEVSNANRTKSDLLAALVTHGDRSLSDAEAHEALLQASVRVVMRLVVCLFAESRQLLPVNDPVYDHSYGVRSLYELLDEATRHEGGTHVLLSRNTAWPRLMALFRLVHCGSAHGAFPLRPYGGVLFRPGDATSDDAVARALHILEHDVAVSDVTIYYVLRKLLRGPLPVLRGRAKTFVEGPVDYTDLRTEFIGLIYEGLLDYRLKRTDEQTGPQVFLNIGREPVLPLSRLTDMLQNDKKGLKDLLTTLRKEKVTATAADDTEESDEEAEEPADATDETATDDAVEIEAGTDELLRSGDFLDAVEAALGWARDAVTLAGLVSRQGRRETDSEYRNRIDAESKKLIRRVVSHGEFYLVRAGNTRKGTGTFYTRPQLAVPTTHRTLQPLCYDKAEDGSLIPRKPEDILGLKVCDPACGSASFLVAALHYLTEALYRSLCHHRQLDTPAKAKKITLPFGRSRTNTEADQLVPFAPDDKHRGHLFEDRIKALLRRHVVERCIYGVDINPLAVELARVSLWVETLDPELPFSFLDHKVKVGNALVGCWLDRVEDYPLKAWEREGGDGKDGPRTQRIETFLKGDKIGNRRSGDGRIKQEMRQVIEAKFGNAPRLFATATDTSESVITETRAEYEHVHDLESSDPDERERYYRQHIENSETLLTLKRAMDEWCAVWFWPSDDESLQDTPTPLTFHRSSERKDAIVARLRDELRFLHWELEFPDVFTPDRSGFDGMIGNPPWDVMKPNSQEFFTEFDPLYRTYDKQAALKKQKALLEALPHARELWDDYNARFKSLGNWAKHVAEPFNMALSRGRDGEALAKLWASHRQAHHGYADARHPFRLQGSADLNLYKLFAELFWQLLQNDGRLGVILPTGVYSDLGTKDLREELLNHGRLDLLYAFQNEKKVFAAAHHSFKQVAIFGTRGGHTQSFSTRFRMGVGNSPESHEIPDDILLNSRMTLQFTPSEIRYNSPTALSLVELNDRRDLDVFRKIYSNSFRIGTAPATWNTSYAAEFHSTSDSKLFPPLDAWEKRGYVPDRFGCWRTESGETALPVCQGGMLHILDPQYNGWANRQWRRLPTDCKSFSPRGLMGIDDFVRHSAVASRPRLAYRRIARTTDTRSFICSYLPPLPSTDSVFLLLHDNNDPHLLLQLSSILGAMSFDWVLRQRLSGTNISWFVLQECPVPSRVATESTTHVMTRLLHNASRLSLLHCRFAPEWLRLKSATSDFDVRQWKEWWAVTETDRVRLRVEVEALVADLYGLERDDFAWIVRDDPKDSKGFYRVDRQLPFRERLTGLAASAFWALKDGKWSAETAADLSNDEFFEMLGIPELTNAEAAQAKGLQGPLILKRDGCHVWRPETFPEDDPRHGWTWDDCWKDAVALLGSEEAVRKYIAGEPEPPEAPAAAEPKRKGSKDLFGNPIPVKPKQKKMF